MARVWTRLSVIVGVVLLVGSGTVVPAVAAAGRPVVTGLSAYESPVTGGGVLKVRGKRLNHVRSVKIGGREVRRVGRATSRSLRVVVPRHDPGATWVTWVTVRTRAGRSAHSVLSQLTYIAPPAVSGVSPAILPADGVKRIEVTGRGFRRVSAVWVGALRASAVTVQSDRRLIATVEGSAAGVVPLRVAGAFGTSAVDEATVTLLPRPRIANATLPPGVVGQPYDVALSSVAPVSAGWEVSGGTLPPGLQLRNARITGTPTAARFGAIVLRLADPLGQHDEREFTISVTDPRWSISDVPTPPDGAIGTSYLQAVDCPTVDTCAAVGGYYSVDDERQGLLATWTDGTWHTTAMQAGGTPGYVLEGEQVHALSCGAPGHCAVIGRIRNGSPVVATLDGGVWTTTFAPTLADTTTNILRSVSCRGTDVCVAVGDGWSGGLIETFQDGSWEASAPPGAANRNAVLSGVSCAAPASCTAVGQYRDASGVSTFLSLALSDGQWRQETVSRPPESPNGAATAELLDIACQTADTCTAAGRYNGHGAIATKSARGWTTTTQPSDDTYVWTRIACADDRCLVAGRGRTVPTAFATLDGGKRRDVALPTSVSGIRSLSCASASFCGFTADAFPRNEPGAGVVGTVDDASASVQRAPLPADANTDRHEYMISRTPAVSCPAPGHCVVVGSYESGDIAKPIGYRYGR